MSSQESGTVSKSQGVGSPAVALPHQAFYPNSGVNSPARFASNYDAVMHGLPYKQVGDGAVLVLAVCFDNVFCSFFQNRLYVPHWYSALLLYVCICECTI